MGEPRLYRALTGNRHLSGYRVCVKETDLWIQTEAVFKEKARESIFRHRGYLESHIAACPEFLTAMAPLPTVAPAPAVVREMAEAARAAGVGPMAAVAGALAEAVGRELLEDSREAVVENGGDIFAKLNRPFTMAIDAGASPLSYKIGLELDASDTALGVCTSSGTVGHSISYGCADAVCVVSESCALSDAAATAIANRVSGPEAIDAACDFGRSIERVQAVAVIVGDRIGLWGNTAIVPIRRAGP